MMNSADLNNWKKKLNYKDYEGLVIECKKLGKEIEDNSRRLEGYKVSLSQTKDNYKELKQLKFDWYQIYYGDLLNDNLSVIKSNLEKLKVTLDQHEHTRALIEKRSAESVDSGFVALESSTETRLLVEIRELEKLSKKKEDIQLQKRLQGIKKNKKDELEKLLKSDRQLSAEKKLVEFGRLVKSKEEEELENQGNEIFDLINSRETLVEIEREYRRLKELYTQAIQTLDTAERELNALDKNSTKFQYEMECLLSSDSTQGYLSDENLQERYEKMKEKITTREKRRKGRREENRKSFQEGEENGNMESEKERYLIEK